MSPARTCRRARWTPAADRHPAFRRRGGARRGRAVGGPVVLDAELPEDGYGVLCLSSAGRPVSCAKGLVLQAHADMAEAGELAVLLHPGGRGTRGLMVAPGHLAWVQHQRRKVPLLTRRLLRRPGLCGSGAARRPARDDAPVVARPSGRGRPHHRRAARRALGGRRRRHHVRRHRSWNRHGAAPGGALGLEGAVRPGAARHRVLTAARAPVRAARPPRGQPRPFGGSGRAPTVPIPRPLCATLGPRWTWSLIRAPVRPGGTRMGSLVVNFGGPGGRRHGNLAKLGRGAQADHPAVLRRRQLRPPWGGGEPSAHLPWRLGCDLRLGSGNAAGGGRGR